MTDDTDTKGLTDLPQNVNHTNLYILSMRHEVTVTSMLPRLNLHYRTDLPPLFTESITVSPVTVPNGIPRRLTLKSRAVATFNQDNSDLQDLLGRSLEETLKHSQQGHIWVFLQHQLIVFALSDSVVDPLGTPRLESVVQRVTIPGRVQMLQCISSQTSRANRNVTLKTY